ncbi:ABC transporter ATP-binding protein/permease [Pseudomonas sp. GD03858]|uniref:ABC transporter ATP-binding protein/permease n=1 Tax=unclassified Pseudomonas TaxID=196821 RepID=UPI00244D15CD|nr:MULTISPECIES: ABC transporter ATP-binding protein/permease [unclassified Pseudomonas]MDH0645725.1 ABC transporter ATP-binding protein/permease [Pseudomonas sp. GD03867]MDH0661168.1 ABC transporter ATP-binding protein/permease [Pseudomonas sp. GD03858]
MNRLRQFWVVTRPFWCSRQAWPAWGLLATVLGLTLFGVWLNVRLNEWNGAFYNALQAVDGPALYRLLYQFAGLALAMILSVVYADYLRKQLLIRWRAWLTEHVVGRWLATDACHYRLQLQGHEPDNPDQRIADDIRQMIELSLQLLLSFVRALVTLVSFVAILWALSGSFAFSLWGSEYRLPGYMVWACVLYTVLGIGLTQWIGGSLQRLNYQQQQREADYRGALILRRRHAEAIAGQHGEGSERRALGRRFAEVVGNWYRLMRAERNLAFFTVGYKQVTIIAPFFFALPAFLAGQLQLGGLMRIQSAFGQVSGSLSWFIHAYRDIALWSACVERLHGFVRLLEADRATAPLAPRTSVLLEAHLSVRQADDDPLLAPLALGLRPGSLTLLHGRSGVGKSTLLRTLAGFWPHYSGRLMRREEAFWIPQQAYLADEPLAELLAYPRPAADFPEAQLVQALADVGLGEWAGRAWQRADWNQRLSGGERQRLLFARLLLNQPRLLLLDEITSALDPQTASELLSLLRERLPDSAILLVSHQPHLAALADTVIELGVPQSAVKELPVDAL